MTAKEALASIKNLLKVKFSDDPGAPALESGKLSDGTVIEFSKLEAGGTITMLDADGNSAPAPIGDLELEDGRIIVITEPGIIAEVKEAGTPPADDQAPVNEEMVAQIKDLQTRLAASTKQVKDLTQSLSAFKKATGETLQAFSEFMEAIGSEESDDKASKPKQSVFAEQKKKNKEAAKAKAEAGFKAFRDHLKQKK